MYAFCVLFMMLLGGQVMTHISLVPLKGQILSTWFYCESIGGGIYMYMYIHVHVCMYVFMCVCVGLWSSHDDGL